MGDNIDSTARKSKSAFMASNCGLASAISGGAQLARRLPSETYRNCLQSLQAA
jgi:hypothetical protein